MATRRSTSDGEARDTSEQTQQLDDFIPDENIPDGWVPDDPNGNRQEQIYRKVLANGFAI